MLRLRTLRGVEEWEYRREFSMSFEPLERKLEEYEHQGWAIKENCRWHLTPKGFLVSNQLIGDLLTVQEISSLRGGVPQLRPGGKAGPAGEMT